MKSFEYAAPSSLRAVTDLLGDQWGKTEILAGGTDLVTCLKQHLTSPERVVSLKNVAELKGIQISTHSVRVGAMTTLAELIANGTVRQSFPSLTSAAEGVGSPQLLNMGTVGGDLCQRPRCWYFRNGFGLFAKQGDVSLVREGENRYHAIFSTDGPALFVSASSLGPALIALDATVSIAGPQGQARTVPAGDFFRIPKDASDRETILKPNEILAAIEIPLLGLKNATYEVRHRQGLDWPYVTASVAWARRGNMLSNCRVVLGQVAPIPWTSKEAAALLQATPMDASAATRCAEAATKGAKPLSQNGYKVQLVKAAVKRAVLAADKS